ncbi:hypothetical protein D9M70_521000 [compost metagenome]
MQKTDRAHIEVGEDAHQARRGRLSVHGERKPSGHRHTNDLPALLHILRQAVGESLLIPTLFVVLGLFDVRRRALRIAGVFDLRDGLQQFRVAAAAVVALAVVLDHQLPVRLLDDRRLESYFRVCQVVARKVGQDRSAELFEGWRVVRKTDEQISADFLDVDRLEGVFALVEVVAHFFGKNQLALAIVSPLVVRAGEIARAPFFSKADARTAVTAGVVKCAYGTIMPAHDNC